MDKPVGVSAFEPPEDTTFTLSAIALDVQLQDGKSKSRPGGVTIDAAELSLQASKAFNGHVYRRGQQMFLKYHQGEADECVVKLTVKDMEFVDIGRGADGAGAVSGGGGGAGARAPSAVGQLIKVTTVQIAKAAHKDNENLKLTGSSSGKAVKIIDKGFNFGELGIGGLDAQFQEIFRRAFASRMVPPAVLKKMGQTHVRGMLLYGPPGCGKTLIARKLAQALHAAPPKIVNGPEILNKYVGASEEAVRALFKEAEAEQAEKGDDSELHIIILDEMDAILRSRGSTSGGTGVNDSVVNQFLSKIDGVEALNNILLIGMTNRKDMIDEAILRPGRLEIHVEIGLPDEPGRVQVLGIHTKALRANGMLADDVSVEDIAARAKN
jgi:vesicle-fusing ATPase